MKAFETADAGPLKLTFYLASLQLSFHRVFHLSQGGKKAIANRVIEKMLI